MVLIDWFVDHKRVASDNPSRQLTHNADHTRIPQVDLLCYSRIFHICLSKKIFFCRHIPCASAAASIALEISRSVSFVTQFTFNKCAKSAKSRRLHVHISSINIQETKRLGFSVILILMHRHVQFCMQLSRNCMCSQQSNDRMYVSKCIDALALNL